MPFDGHAGQWEPGKREPPTRQPRWLFCSLVVFGAVMGAVFGFQTSVAAGVIYNMVLLRPNALTTVPAPLFQHLTIMIIGACAGACVSVWVIQGESSE